jgi:hypothetical protein
MNPKLTCGATDGYWNISGHQNFLNRIEGHIKINIRRHHGGGI